jgi:hypothetical protein
VYRNRLRLFELGQQGSQQLSLFGFCLNFWRGWTSVATGGMSQYQGLVEYSRVFFKVGSISGSISLSSLSISGPLSVKMSSELHVLQSRDVLSLFGNLRKLLSGM